MNDANPDSYVQHATAPLRETRLRVAVVGAGISGLMCARTLLDHGVAVTVFEKSRGVGGRMATRRTAEGPAFDHGAQYFTVRDERFERYVKSWMQDGIVAPWEARICTLTDGRSEWSNTRLDDEPDQVLPRLLDAFWKTTGASPSTSIYAASHRWRWALPQKPLSTRCLFDSRLRLGACGDWCSVPRVEGAFLSGMAVAGRVLAEI